MEKTTLRIGCILCLLLIIINHVQAAEAPIDAGTNQAHCPLPSAANLDTPYKQEKAKPVETLFAQVYSMNPALNTFFSLYQDSDDIEILQLQETIGVSIAEKTTLRHIYGRNFYREPNVHKVDEQSFGFGLTHFINGKGSLSGTYTYRDFTPAYDAHNYALEYKGPFLFLDKIKVKHSYLNLGTARAIQAKVKYFSNAVSLDQSLPWHFSCNAWYQFNTYNDNNWRHSGRLGVFYTIPKIPVLKAGYDFEFKDSRFNSPAYSTPQTLQIYQPKLFVQGNLLESKIYYDASCGYGYASEDGEDDKNVVSLAAYVEFDLIRFCQFYLYYDFYKDPTYDGHTIQGAVQMKF